MAKAFSGKGCDKWIKAVKATSRNKLEEAIGLQATAKVPMPENISEESCINLVEQNFGKSLGHVFRQSRNKKHRTQHLALLKGDPLVGKTVRVWADLPEEGRVGQVTEVRLEAGTCSSSPRMPNSGDGLSGTSAI